MKLNIKVVSKGGVKAMGQPCPWIMDVPPEAQQK